MRGRALGVRPQIAIAMVALAVLSVAVAWLLIHRAADDELRDFGRQDLQQSANRLAASAALEYEEAGRWTEQFLRDVRTAEAEEGHVVVLLDGRDRPLRGSAPMSPPDSRRATVVAQGRRVGTVVIGHPSGGFLQVGRGVSRRRLDAQLGSKLDERLLESAAVGAVLALILGLVVAFRVTQPIQQVTAVARRMAQGEIETRATGYGGSREAQELAQTLDRLAAALRRQDELRRATVADVVHELRNGMVGVVGRLEALQDGVVPDEQATIERAASDARRVNRLVDDLLLLAEAQKPSLLVRKGAVELHDLCADRVAHHAERFHERGIALASQLAPARVIGDPQRLVQIVDNLLSNALRYTDPGGRVLVRLETRGDAATLQVADTGIGIAPEHVSRVFDRFWRAPESKDRAEEGFGVGLALVRDLVVAQEGRVEVQSRLGKGSTFSVHLPLAVIAELPVDGARPAGAPDADDRRDAVPAA
jgi:signal transduction histidine kinase